MWGHQYQGVAPDIVTMGKPMANGHPVGAVVTSQDTMAAFRSAFRYFNTFGGNPVSCAAAMAVLDEITDQGLMQNAAQVGSYAVERLRELAERHDAIGDVRGRGLIFGIELVTNRATNEPATAMTHEVVNQMRARGILLSSLGRHKNALKIRPPMVFSRENVDHLIEVLDSVLTDMAA